ncbi:RagB/SusD family nutrient uptake outer membrane protein [Bacteroides acidifaciens]|uniref:RagB/SusD family nutrient uptake outer membrane protein n=1 Tax=Bacteroides acidifaciens TaxID=85831 RepID=UPI002431139C|nr:RagB/SusD family nutrient uptake outer membrane protein [Bacteroides acidifaciens]
MIKKLYIAFILASSSLMSSCDSFLDIQPVGKVIPNTLEEYRALFATAYNVPLIDRSLCDMRTGDITIRKDEYDQNNYGDIEKWADINPGPETTTFEWSKYYTNIYYANAIIDKKDEITEGTQEDINQLVGEAYLMRGYMHFLLVNLYGEPYTKTGATETKAIPIKLNLDLEEVPSRSTVGEVYTAIISDIESARKLINKKEWDAGYNYRFSTLSVDALESRIYLYMGEWQKAYDAAERVLAQSPVLENFNNEDSKLPNQYQSIEMITAYETIYNSSIVKASQATESFVQQFDQSNDLRLSRYFGNVNSDGNYPIRKTDGYSQYRCSFRTGELYLNIAEAAAHLNNLSEARNRLLHLMENRYTSEGYEEKKNSINAMNQNNLIKEILNERARELAFEGHRWFDLRRTTRPSIQKVIDGQSYTLEENDARYTLRIPQAAIDANPGLLN